MGEKSRGNWRVDFCPRKQGCANAGTECDVCRKYSRYVDTSYGDDESYADGSEFRGAHDVERRLTREE